MSNSIEFIKSWGKENKIIAGFCLFVLAEIILYFICAHGIVEAIYNGSIPGFPTLKGKSVNSLEFYLNRADKFFVLANAYLALSISGISFFIRVFAIERINLSAILKREVIKFRQLIAENKKTIILLCSLTVGFYCLYLLLGLLIIPGYGYNKFTFYFADQGDWGELDWSRYHKGSHPLRLLILAPFGLLKLLSPPVPKIVLAIILNSFFGAVGIFLASLCFWNITQKHIPTLLWTGLFGLSMTQMFFSTLIESRVLGTASIIATYVLFIICLKQQKLYLGYWILAGLLSFGVTITNFSHTLICFTVLVLGLNLRNRIVRVMEYVGGIFIIAFVLSLIQKQLFNGKYFFIPGTVSKELEWVNITIFNQPLVVSQELIRHFFLVNFIAPSPFPDEIIPGTKIILDLFNRPMIYNTIGLISVILWLLFLAVGLYKNISSMAKPNNRYFFIALILVTISNLMFYSIFDVREMFIFTPYFSFPVVLLALNPSIMKKRYFIAGTILLVGCMGINNLIVIGQIISLARS
ncbi:hypothetical protein [Limnofasciculus baicalensis]|uniref:Uncharacterized protein n=1 Tax=Limnofasciculus baicalensis BBK-W-15 TaxID=2699891 RepID=A0AAE3GN59_9CYAN|nr:hypothetical protein [Limnofasciculus baicalensis]MCP2726906.1 hypothetical protein [Limnofasciculus baicalensis BBK-W-15]